MEVNILGITYEIEFSTAEQRPRLKTCAGYMDFSTKKIVVEKFVPDEMSVEDLSYYTKKVLRHEIIHAFLWESGLWENSDEAEAWAQSEEMTDWIAIQFPKLTEAFRQADCL